MKLYKAVEHFQQKKIPHNDSVTNTSIRSIVSNLKILNKVIYWRVIFESSCIRSGLNSQNQWIREMKIYSTHTLKNFIGSADSRSRQALRIRFFHILVLTNFQWAKLHCNLYWRNRRINQLFAQRHKTRFIKNETYKLSIMQSLKRTNYTLHHLRKFFNAKMSKQ